MGPLEIPRNEHGLMRQHLDNLQLAAEKLEADERPPKELFEQAEEAFEKHHKMVVDMGSMLVHM